MAACQVIQKHGDADVALSKYRIVYGRKPECAQVWNNIGMCFFSKKKFVAAVSCLKRANYLAPFELYVLYNLALVHLYLQQNASAAIFLQAAIRLNRKHAPSYALLGKKCFSRDDCLTWGALSIGVALSRLNDPDNALRAYTYSLKLDPTDPMTLLNLAILQTNTGASQSKIDVTLQQFRQCYADRAASVNQRELDPNMMEIAGRLGSAPSAPASPPPSHATKTDEHETVPLPSASVFSPRKPYEVKGPDEEAPKKGPPQELPAVRTKIYDDGRHRSKRGKQLEPASPDADAVQNEDNELGTAF